MDRVLPGLFRLKVPIPNNPLGHTNVYLLEGEDGYLLIDAGFNSPEAIESLQKQVSETGADIVEISRMVITHAHGDHIGLAGKIRDMSGAKISMHRLERQRHPPHATDRAAFLKHTEKWLRSSGMPQEELRRDGGPPLPPSNHTGAQAREWRHFEPPAKPDATIEDGERIRWGDFDLEAILTPGHSPGHICLYDAGRRLLFSGDHVLPQTTPNIGLRPGQPGRGNPLGDYLTSLDRVGDLDVGLVLPAHEGAFHDLPARIAGIKEHHRRRSQEIMDTLGQGHRTGYQVAESVTWIPDSGGVHFHKLRHWDQRMAVSETLSHLEALRSDGSIRRLMKDGVVYYQIDPKH